MKREDVKRCLKETISGMTLQEFSRLFVNEVTAIEDFFKLCKDIKAGNTISLLFNPHRLNIITEASVTRTSAPMSIFQSLSDRGSDKYTEKIDGMSRLYLYNLEQGVNNPFYCTIQRGYNGVAYVNEFPPFVARQIYKKYTKGDSRVILDPCAGWGGRMIGAASLPNTRYVACETCPETYNGLIKLGNWLKSLQPTFDFEVHNIPYEEFETDEKFDIALTSPPYFNTEHYSEENTDSAHKFPEYDLWVNGFYSPLITNTVSRLKDSAVFVLNIGDRKYPLTNSMVSICADNNLYYERAYDYLSGNGEDKEKFFCISHSSVDEYPPSSAMTEVLW